MGSDDIYADDIGRKKVTEQADNDGKRQKDLL